MASVVAPSKNASLPTGHSNSFQLGTNGKAYISGWDDSKVYVIDLDTLTIADTITLPVSGYTTVAVDDVNSLAYIFQRDSEPTTVERYNFIVYNYSTEDIISTRQIFAYGAMQSVDFYKDRIIMLYGGGTSALPNGCVVLNTQGDIIASYEFASMSAVEPEGVCIDRDTEDLYVSYANTIVYKVCM